MDDKARTARIENKLDTVITKLGSQDVTLAEIKKDLAYHIHRTNILEKKVVPLVKIYHWLIGSIAVVGFLGGLAEVLGVFRHGK